MGESRNSRNWNGMPWAATWLWSHVLAFATSRRAVVMIYFAIALVPLLLMAGGAIDFGRLYYAKSKLYYALDQALLAAGAGDPADVTATFNSYFLANYPVTTSVGTATATAPVVNGSEITASATVVVPTAFLYLANIDDLSVTVEAQVIGRRTGIELALVLDNTDSLTPAELAELKTAANNLVTILFNGASGLNDVKISVVPYTSTVNIGNSVAMSAFIKNPPNALEYPFNPVTPTDPDWDFEWKGCVETRDIPHDAQDNYVESDPVQGEWPPYFWEAESYYQSFSTASAMCANPWWRPDAVDPGVMLRPIGRGGALPFVSVPGSFEDPSMNPLPDVTSPVTTGPNKGCPTPILPLTSNQVDITTAINNMETWEAGGTATSVGAAWGLRTLSQMDPFDEGVAYGTPNIKKVLIIMTDGRSVYADQFPTCFLNTGKPEYNSQYMAYGYVSEGRVGTNNRFLAPAEFNSRLIAACDDAKKPGVEIEIYTITFGSGVIGTPIPALMESCSGSPSRSLHAATGAQLTAKFQAIGAQLTNLRLAR